MPLPSTSWRKLSSCSRGEPAQHERARIDAGRGVALHEDQVAAVVLRRRVPEMVEADVVERRRRRVARDVAADVGVLVRAQHHRHRVPAGVVADPLLDRRSRRAAGLQVDRDGVDVVGVRREGQVGAGPARLVDQLLEQEVRPLGALCARGRRRGPPAIPAFPAGRNRGGRRAGFHRFLQKKHARPGRSLGVDRWAVLLRRPSNSRQSQRRSEPCLNRSTEPRPPQRRQLHVPQKLVGGPAKPASGLYHMVEIVSIFTEGPRPGSRRPLGRPARAQREGLQRASTHPHGHEPGAVAPEARRQQREGRRPADHAREGDEPGGAGDRPGLPRGRSRATSASITPFQPIAVAPSTAAPGRAPAATPPADAAVAKPRRRRRGPAPRAPSRAPRAGRPAAPDDAPADAAYRRHGQRQARDHQRVAELLDEKHDEEARHRHLGRGVDERDEREFGAAAVGEHLPQRRDGIAHRHRGASASRSRSSAARDRSAASATAMPSTATASSASRQP